MKESIFNFFDSVNTNDHIAHIYGKRSERFELGARFIADGLRNQQQCIVISDQKTPSDLISRIELYNIDIKQYKNKKMLREVNLHEHGITERNPEELLDLIDNISRNEDTEVKRLIISRQIAFFFLKENYQLNLEAKLSQLTLNKPLITMNQFDIGKINAKALLNIMKTHPILIEEENVYKNSLYTKPHNTIQKLNREIDGLDKLTRQEIIILTGIVNGDSNRDISEDLSISVRTVETHRYNIMKKTETKSVIELIKFAIKNGLY